jgi:hypothetical protein
MVVIMKKTPAQIIRESMDMLNKISENVITEAPDYRFVASVTNPFMDDTTRYPDPEEVPEELEVGVNYSIFGKNRPATFDHPAEYAEVDIDGVYDLATGEDIQMALPEKSIEVLKQKAIEHADEEAEHAAIDREEASRNDDRYFDRY